ncbi:MAG: copper amine oxidase N-terminal domain-containing protein [Acidobacteriota bacterium]
MRSLGRKRAISIVLALMMTLAIVAPVLVSPAPAAASTTYTALTVPVLKLDTTMTNQVLARVLVEISAGSLTTGDAMTISVPSQVTLGPVASFNGTAGAISATDFSTYIFPTDSTPGNATNFIYLYTPATYEGVTNAIYNGGATAGNGTAVFNSVLLAKKSSAQTLEIAWNPSCSATYGISTKGWMYIYFFASQVQTGISGDITATFVAPANSGFTSNAVVIGKAQGTGSTTAMVKDVYNFSPSNDQSMGWIVIAENAYGSVASLDTIKLKLPAGFTWRQRTAANWAAVSATSPGISYISPQWGFSSAQATWKWDIGDDNRTLIITNTADITHTGTQAGRITLKGLGISVNEVDAKQGDVVAHLWSTMSGTYVTEQDLTLGTYGTYGVTVAEKTTPEIKAGRIEQTIGDFTVKENLPGSLLQDRTVTMTLPAGARWRKASPSTFADNADSFTASTNVTNETTGNVTFTNSTTDTMDYTSDGRILKLNVATTSTSAGKPAELTFKKLLVDTAPNFEGDLKIDIAGTAGAAGTIKVATVKPLFTVTADATPKLQIGMQNQKANDLVIAENFKEALEKTTGIVAVKRSDSSLSTIAPVQLQLELPPGSLWYSRPTITVEEGDIVIDSASMTLADALLSVNVKISSSKPSKIKVSNIAVTLDRTVPEGDFKIKVKGDATAETYLTYPEVTSQGKYNIGTCVTPAPSQTGRNASFYIGSNVMESDGTKVIMDVAPYIKDGRTFVPVKFLGQALGVADSNIVWDATAQTATLTKDAKTIVLTIGSKTAKVNGADVAMDVAPEIVGGRTMLPARYVAEGLGYQVGYIASTKQVVIQ